MWESVFMLSIGRKLHDAIVFGQSFKPPFSFCTARCFFLFAGFLKKLKVINFQSSNWNFFWGNRGAKSPFRVILYFKHSLSSLTQNPSFENNALTRTQKQSAKPRKCSSLPKRKQLTTLATSRTSLLILSLILNFYMIILFTEWPAQSLRSLVRIIARG